MEADPPLPRDKILSTVESSAKAILIRLVEERHHSVELLPGIRNFELIAVLVGEFFILLRIVEPVLEVEHHIGVAVGLITVQAALVVVRRLYTDSPSDNPLVRIFPPVRRD